MKKIYKIIIIIIAALAALTLLFAWGRYESTKAVGNPVTPILFYGDGCPHCANVETYISTNGVKNKLNFSELEVFNHPNNAALMAEKAKLCGLNTDQGLGVPFFFTGTTCLVGDQDIINYFSQLK
jgi:glutaredoxin